MSAKYQATTRLNASQRYQASGATAEPAAAAEEGTPSHLPRSAAAPWSMPLKFLPLPKGFSCAGSSTRIDMRSKSHTQLMALAARHNSRQGIREDPFAVRVHGGRGGGALWRSHSELVAELCPTTAVDCSGAYQIKLYRPSNVALICIVKTTVATQ
jgi:hypothetical protein